MGEYGPGLTSGQCFNMDKERIKHALRGELVCGESENGFEYAPAPQEECEKFIISAFDNAVFQCKQAHDAGRAHERILKECTKLSDKEIMAKYIKYMAEESQKYNDYIYEHDIEN